jgi:aspartyl/asparaginyl-tRNA synthetase
MVYSFFLSFPTHQLQVISTARYALLPLSLQEVESEEYLQSTTTELAKSLVLTCDNKYHITRCHAMLRFLSSLAPTLQLQGSSEIHRALVDDWLELSGEYLEGPILEILEDANSATAQKKMENALSILDHHFKDKVYRVGDCVTLADISVAILLQKAASFGVKTKHSSVATWYESITRQECFSNTPSPSTTTNTTEIIPFTRNLCSGLTAGNTLYRRHRIRIQEALTGKYGNQTITVAGWARTIRSANKGKLLFVELNDGSTVSSLQCVLNATTTANFEPCKASGGTGASFQLQGTLIPSQGTRQALEMQVSHGTLLGALLGGKDGEMGGRIYPLSKKKHSLEHMREHAHLRARGRLMAAVLRVRHAMTMATHQFFHQHGFVHCHTPIITRTADLEGADDQFAVVEASDGLEGVTAPSKRKEKSKCRQNFFGKPVHLTVSGQFHAEAMACSLSEVYTFGPAFRADRRQVQRICNGMGSAFSNTCQHVLLSFFCGIISSSQLSEYWMVEVEIAFVNLNDCINLAEDYLKYCVRYALDYCADELQFLESYEGGEIGLTERLKHVWEKPFQVC